MHSSLRNPNINYRDGWFFVTMQVAHNKTVFGAITGSGCVLNALGERVRAAWEGTLARHPEIARDSYVLMPNHFHAIVRIANRPTNRTDHLSFVVGNFKRYAAHEYLALIRAGQCVDIGRHLWHPSFYDELMPDVSALMAIRRYIELNPARWDGDRFGPVTAQSVGEVGLLNRDLVAFVASEGWAGEVPPREWRKQGRGPEAPPNEGKRPEAPLDAGANGAETHSWPVISTFTSPQERAMLAKCLATKRPFVRVAPGGIPDPLPPEVAAACAEGRGLVVSPVPSGTGVNKQRAIWCNRYVLDAARRIWCGTIRPGGTLETLLHGR